MTDIALVWNAETMSADFELTGGQLRTDSELHTAMLISLFTDARAREGDVIPDGADRRGWWGDLYAENANDVTGSRLWLLVREKLTSQTIMRARDYAREALAWLVEDGVVTRVDVDVEARGNDQIAIGVSVARPMAPGRQRFDYVWDRFAALERMAA